MPDRGVHENEQHKQPSHAAIVALLTPLLTAIAAIVRFGDLPWVVVSFVAMSLTILVVLVVWQWVRNSS